eukprot:scaffold42145_cov221-Amphora_coffeaeformis.AAC.1
MTNWKSPTNQGGQYIVWYHTCTPNNLAEISMGVGHFVSGARSSFPPHQDRNEGFRRTSTIFDTEALTDERPKHSSYKQQGLHRFKYCNEQDNMPKKESLPVGVGRVPAWWMELTPHYTLDLEEDENRRQQEEQEALYYAQMAAADDARSSGEWKSNWGGRSANGGGAGGEGGEPLFGGRNFQPGSDGWDPKEWGIEANDPDYKSYLQGAKLPQSYIDAMKAFGGQHGIKYDASTLKHTGSMYGSAAGKPTFTPAWAKKGVLRSTGQGAAIRHGVYNDSPNKHLKKKGVNQMAQEHEGSGSPPSSPQLEVPPTPAPEPVTPSAPVPAPVAPPSPAPAPVAPPVPAPVPPSQPVAPPAPPKPVASPPVPKWKTSTPAPKPVVYQLPSARTNTPAPIPVEEPITAVEKPKYSFNDYYYNAGAAPPLPPTKPAAPEQAPPKPASPPSPPPAPTPVVASAPPPPPQPQEPQEEEDEVEYEEVVEYVEEGEGEEGEEYEEYVEEYEEEYEEEAPAVPDSSGLNDLQALLAQKQAELAKLQGINEKKKNDAHSLRFDWGSATDGSLPKHAWPANAFILKPRRVDGRFHSWFRPTYSRQSLGSLGEPNMNCLSRSRGAIKQEGRWILLSENCVGSRWKLSMVACIRIGSSAPKAVQERGYPIMHPDTVLLWVLFMIHFTWVRVYQCNDSLRETAVPRRSRKRLLANVKSLDSINLS